MTMTKRGPHDVSIHSGKSSVSNEERDSLPWHDGAASWFAKILDLVRNSMAAHNSQYNVLSDEL